VAESGLTSAGDLQDLKRRGYDGVLMGERFMTASDPGEALAGLLGSAGQ
jgi:indole-3-glycerol phosphate synthase